MKVPVFIRYSKLEEICDCDGQEGIVCDDFRAESFLTLIEISLYSFIIN